VLDGIVIDAWVRISLVGIDLITVEARIVIASIDTYLRYAEAGGLTPAVSRPAMTAGIEAIEEDGRRRVPIETKSIPTIIIFKDGVAIDRLAGPQSKAALLDKLKAVIG
jgi:hypothetical protein